MIINLERKYIFVANLKTASTAIETVLRPFAEIALCEARFGKHLYFREIEDRFAWVFELIDRGEFFVFGVIRDPVDYVISLYNSHADPKFANEPRLCTAGMELDRFLDDWAEVNADQLSPQYLRFVAQDGTIAANYIISYAKLAEGLDYVSQRIDLPALRSPPLIDVSQRHLRRDQLTNSHLDQISKRFDLDIAFGERYCDRPLSGEACSIGDAVLCQESKARQSEEATARDLCGAW